MAVDKDLDSPEGVEPLYAWWLDLIGGLAGVAIPTPPDGTDGAQAPFPIAQMSDALRLAQQLVGPLYQGYFQSLLANPDPGKAFIAFQEQVQDQLKKAADALGGFAQTTGDLHRPTRKSLACAPLWRSPENGSMKRKGIVANLHSTQYQNHCVNSFARGLPMNCGALASSNRSAALLI